jgi:hypothetical protein
MEEQQQYYEDAQPSNRQQSFSTPMEKLGQTVLEITNPESELMRLENSWKGYIVNNEGDWVKSKYLQPLMNDIGIAKVMMSLRSTVNRVGVMTNLDIGEVKALTYLLLDALSEDLMKNKTKYDIKSDEDRTTIITSAISLAYLCLKRPYEQGERKFLTHASQEQRITTSNQERKQGIMQKFIPWVK